MTTTTTYDYRAQTDAATAAWHLGAAERGAACFCGVKLMTPDDSRAFALKVPVEKRGYQTDPDVSRVTCGSCKRNREYAKAVEATAAGQAAPTRRRRQSRADKAHTAAERDRARREDADAGNAG